MITNDIQDLFDGALSDEQSAELLHALSVSPERRGEFRQLMALKGAIKNDRYASSLTPEEDGAAWRGIATAIGASVADTAPRYGFVRWVAGTAALALVGIGGYLLGSHPTELTTTADAAVIGPNDAAVVSVAVDRVRSMIAGCLPLSPAPNVVIDTIVRERLAYRDRWHDRVEVRYRDVPQSSQRGVDNLDGMASVVSAPEKDRSLANTEATNRSSDPMNKQGLIGSAASDAGTTGHTKNIPERGVHDGVSKAGVGTRRPGPIGPTIADAGVPMVPFQAGGFEMAYNERVGRLAALPRGETDSRNYASRYVDFSYRFDQGRYGIGFRIGQGTFSSVSLVGDQTIRRDGAISVIDTIYRPHVGESRENAVEFFANYRFPIGDRFAVGAETSFSWSTTHKRIGGDLSALWFLTNRIGLQVGGGIGHYWYDLTGDRQRLLDGGENVGVSDDALDSYKGSVLEGRYGIFYQF